MFDLSKLGKGEWFPYQDSSTDKETGKVVFQPPDPKSDERVCFKQPTAEFMRALQHKYRGKKINNPVHNPVAKAMEIVVTYDPQTPEQEAAQSREFWNEVIQDWTIKDENGSVIECTAENKYRLVTMVPAFLRFCNNSIELLSGANAEKLQVSEKN